jgi:hypothetical protein
MLKNRGNFNLLFTAMPQSFSFLINGKGVMILSKSDSILKISAKS